jgi:uncharacterized membrane protein YfcA
VPPAVAVGSQAPQFVGSSISGVLAQMRRGNVDFRMGCVLLGGGLVGSALGVWVFGLLRRVGQVDLVISLIYVVLLGIVGGLMLLESVRALHRAAATGQARRGKLHQHLWVHGLPLKMRFPKSKLYISAILPFAVGAGVGVLSALLGVGGGFIMVPAMIYLLGMPTGVVVGTSLFQIVFVSANVTFLQAVQNQTVDILLALALMIGSVVGAQYGARLGAMLRAEQTRALMAALILAIGAKLAVDLVTRPDDVYSLTFTLREAEAP